tara:strand:- start:403 stop:504 length:102 start_codon:yes stop_codon:yes gene_type:complete
MTAEAVYVHSEADHNDDPVIVLKNEIMGKKSST